MKIKNTIGIFLLFVAIAGYLFVRAKAPSTPDTNSSSEMGKGKTGEDVPTPMPPATVPQSNQEETDFSSVLSSDAKELIAKGYVLTADDRKKLLRKMRVKIMMSLAPTPEEIMILMQTPVEFYGQVIDQFDAPVIDAQIITYWPYMESTDAPFETQSSAPTGQFKILGLKGTSKNHDFHARSLDFQAVAIIRTDDEAVSATRPAGGPAVIGASQGGFGISSAFICVAESCGQGF